MKRTLKIAIFTLLVVVAFLVVARLQSQKGMSVIANPVILASPAPRTPIRPISVADENKKPMQLDCGLGLYGCPYPEGFDFSQPQIKKPKSSVH
jgi:hypothetical protein